MVKVGDGAKRGVQKYGPALERLAEGYVEMAGEALEWSTATFAASYAVEHEKEIWRLEED